MDKQNNVRRSPELLHTILRGRLIGTPPRFFTAGRFFSSSSSFSIPVVFRLACNRERKRESHFLCPIITSRSSLYECHSSNGIYKHKHLRGFRGRVDVDGLIEKTRSTSSSGAGRRRNFLKSEARRLHLDRPMNDGHNSYKRMKTLSTVTFVH